MPCELRLPVGRTALAVRFSAESEALGLASDNIESVPPALILVLLEVAATPTQRHPASSALTNVCHPCRCSVSVRCNRSICTPATLFAGAVSQDAQVASATAKCPIRVRITSSQSPVALIRPIGLRDQLPLQFILIGERNRSRKLRFCLILAAQLG